MDSELKALLEAARHGLMNPTDEDGLRTWANVDAVDRIDAYVSKMSLAAWRPRKVG